MEDTPIELVNLRRAQERLLYARRDRELDDYEDAVRWYAAYNLTTPLIHIDDRGMPVWPPDKIKG